MNLVQAQFNPVKDEEVLIKYRYSKGWDRWTVGFYDGACYRDTAGKVIPSVLGWTGLPDDTGNITIIQVPEDITVKEIRVKDDTVIIKNGRELYYPIDRWKSIEDELPPKNEDVYFCDDTYQYIGVYNGGCWITISGTIIQGVTHWMHQFVMPDLPAWAKQDSTGRIENNL